MTLALSHSHAIAVKMQMCLQMQHVRMSSYSAPWRRLCKEVGAYRAPAHLVVDEIELVRREFHDIRDISNA